MTLPHDTGNSRSLSYWIDTTPSTSYPPLANDDRADVAIVGAGIAGITAAYLLTKAGKSVIVLDRERIAMGETGHTTAHLQTILDTRLAALVPRFGLDGARKASDSQREAVDLITEIASEHRIACELERMDAYLYSPRAADRDLLQEELRLARKIGYEAHEADASEVPFECAHAIRFPEQGKFHARKYLLGVAQAAERLGARFFEGTEVREVESGPRVSLTTAAGARVTADWFLSCTNTPFVGRETIHTKLMPYRTYAIGARVPKDIFADRLYWDTLDPYHYTRVEPKMHDDLVILGGEDHRVGEVEDTNKAWGHLQDHLRQATDEALVVYRWSGEVLETQDDLPYIGSIPGRRENELMVTGDSGTGMTNGTIGALMLTERVLGRGTPWDDLYDPARAVADTTAMKEWIVHNARAAATLAKRAAMRSEISDVAELPRGAGAIMKVGLMPIAVARLDDGTLCAVSGVCTHARCTVKWNVGEASWDCGCHGSRFSPTGEIMHGPAAKPLEVVPLDRVLGGREARSATRAADRG